MKRDSRLSSVLHALLHMAAQGRPIISSELARWMSTNPVVVRRTMAGLREAGYVRSTKGHGGGWEIACDLEKVSLKDIYDALGRPTLFAIGAHIENPTCLVERAVNRQLADAFADAEALLISRLGNVSLATLAKETGAGLAQHAMRHNHAV